MWIGLLVKVISVSSRVAELEDGMQTRRFEDLANGMKTRESIEQLYQNLSDLRYESRHNK
jgi:hypothetical protein